MNLRCVKRQLNDKLQPVLICRETYKGGFLWLQIKTKQRVFTGVRNVVADYFSWVEEPNQLIVHDSLSFQLDEWNRIRKDDDA